MNGNGSWVFCAKMFIDHFKELIDNVIWWCRSIDEKQIIVSNLILQEELPIILLLIQSYYACDIKLLEYLNILLRMMPVPLILISFFNRSHECHELAWNNPIDITIFDSLVELIFLDIKCTEIIPLELYCIF